MTNKTDTFKPSEIKELLDSVAEQVNTYAFIETDPVQFPRRYKTKQDIEVSAFLTSTITWGKRSIILKSAEKMHALMGNSPYDFIMEGGYEYLKEKNVHRTFFEDDMAYLCRGLHAIYNEYDSIESLFLSKINEKDRLWDSICLFRNYIISANTEKSHKSLKHVSNPDKSACKRLHLALRWLVRNDGIVDIGLWKNIQPAELFIPLDTHVISVSRKLNLLHRKQNDRKAVEELTSILKMFNPDDPILYDFALFGIGKRKLMD